MVECRYSRRNFCNMYIRDVQFCKYDVFLKVCKEIFQERNIILCYVMEDTLRYVHVVCMMNDLVTLCMV